MKKFVIMLMLALFSCIAGGCGKTDDSLEQYKAEMEAFIETVNTLTDSIENIDTTSDTRMEEMLGYLDEMDAAFAAMGDLEVPEQFANIEELADEASTNLSKSVSLYHQAFDNEEDYDPQLVNAALEYYKRAFKRLDYIGTILQGELPEDETITIIHEDEEDSGQNTPESNEEDSEQNPPKDTEEDNGQSGPENAE